MACGPAGMALGRRAYYCIVRWSFLLLLIPGLARGQALTPMHLTDLPALLYEVSGTMVVDGRGWVVMDSFNPPVLHQVDRSSGNILRSVTIGNAANVDWEEITADGSHVYVGDIGNNLGARTDLRILRFPLALLQDEAVNMVEAETIAYSYEDQTDFTPVPDGTNWDCEAMVAIDDSLFLFTKNWVDQRTHLYALPAQPGTHVARLRGTMDVQGLITGASLRADGGSIALIGHTPDVEPFIWQLSGSSGHAFLSGAAQRRVLDMPVAQTEGIAWYAPDSVLISHEGGTDAPARLWRLHLDLFTGVEGGPAMTAPLFLLDAAQRQLVVKGTGQRTEVRIIDLHGRVQYDALANSDDRIDLRALASGTYVYEQRTERLTQRARFVLSQ